jgi:signal transduction histidine kinase
MDGIDRQALNELFPFNFTVGEELTILDVSPKMTATASEMAIGANLLDCITLERPILKKFSREILLDYKKSTLEIKVLGVSGINFVGQIVQNETKPEEIVFLVKPFTSSLNALVEAGFSLSDFAPSDALPDLLLGIQFAEAKNVQLRQKNHLLREEMVVNKFLSEIFSSDTLEALFLNIAEGVAKALSLNDVIIYKVGSHFAKQVAGAGSLITSAQVTDKALAIPIGKGVIGQSILEKKTQLIADVSKCDHYIKDQASRGGSELTVPIIIDGQVIAVIDSESQETHRYSLEDQHLLEMFAELAGPLIINHARQARQQEGSIKVTQRLRSRNQSLKSISHEFRTPLAQISSGIQLIAKHGDGMGEDEKRETLESLLGPIDRLTDLFNSLMREEKGLKEEIIIEEFCLLRLIHRIAKGALRPYGREEDLTISSEEKQVVINSSRDFLTQIIINLLVNSAKYSASNTEIILSIEMRANRVLISVSDSGIGISPEDLGSVFEPHMRSEKANLMAHGVGLGLSIVRNKAESLGGEVSVTSTDGAGSCFTVSIPKTA